MGFKKQNHKPKKTPNLLNSGTLLSLSIFLKQYLPRRASEDLSPTLCTEHISHTTQMKDSTQALAELLYFVRFLTQG